MPVIWDYDIKKLKRSKWGRRLIVERQINYGVYPPSREKISLRLVKKYWKDLDLEPIRRELFKLLIWGK